MRTLTAILAVAGALWMALVIYKGWVPLAFKTNYLGMLGAHFVQYRGIAPPPTTVWMFNVWLVVTSALQWAIVGLLIHSAIGRLHRFRQ